MTDSLTPTATAEPKIRVGNLLQFFAAAVVIYAACGCGASKTDDGSALFTNGRDLVVNGNYEQAIPVLRDYLTKYQRGKHASRAGLFLGKAFLGLGRLEEAKEAFQTTVRDYPGSLEDHKCRYKLAMVAMLSEDTQEAIRLFGELARKPDGPLAAEATAMEKFLKEDAGRQQRPAIPAEAE